ncbi:MAG: glucose-1-phosphate cytidylyltransferase [Planctomycetota bacterium]|nr:glucose-1-phosphate cytidylyltransferase [Planctomycetota bacterium]MDA0917569.1 glucose-1-phosphate cytidylyltransferase [Planctomycetota bacterium]MDA1159776.1 glucose-1-phosphate cytidylyltransferase [Planctomycetota bacterium]
MKVAILAGGAGTRLSEETVSRPKPMVEIGGRPIIWHIMQHYASYGHNEFAIALGYKGEMIRDFFVSECAASGSVRVDFANSLVSSQQPKNDGGVSDWLVDLVDTGEKTNTGGRIKRLQPFVDGDTFMLTWGDGVSNVDLDALLKFHREHGRLATVTAVHPPGRFGCLDLSGNSVRSFHEKPEQTSDWINGAFFVLEPEIFSYIDGDDTQWELEPMERLAQEGQLQAWKHEGFWQCMDTLKEKHFLESLWDSGNAPWMTKENDDESSGHGPSGIYRIDPCADAQRRRA